MDKKNPTGKTVFEPAIVRDVGDIGRIIQATRKSQQMTQRDIAGLAGLGNRFVVELEQGKPSIQAQKMLEVLGLLGLEVVIREKGR
ncbi:transcriptional regulator [Bordetella ansorpii]|uniref:Transcriptional regulator n=1 Tax=Bordetella ansorpii TaxID=288768 RepID=A0A157L503_9BORD|nr:transcriptional regulator [Bordetella ansorpii]SAH91951.1 transcriptional regulator [Bordetella ansorpii]